MTALRADNTSGLCGVAWHKYTGKWHAYIRVDERLFYLGTYTDWFDAACARKAADYQYRLHPNHARKL